MYEPMNDESHKPTKHSLTEREFNVACEVYAKTGSKNAAILAISRGAKDGEGRPSRRRTLEDALRLNPLWAQRWADAREEALGLVEAEIAKAALTVDTRPIFDKAGRLLGVQQDSRPRNDMLKFLARKLSPEWRDTRQLQIEGSIDHNVQRQDGFGVFVSAADVLSLEGADRAEFVRLISLIRDRRTPESPNVIDQSTARPVRLIDSRREQPPQTGSGEGGAQGQA